MAEVWDFFEKMDEIVYVSDIDTHELIYMNRRLREDLGYRSHDEYQGNMCYEVLQGFREPCTFCTNQQLKEGEFVSWAYENPILHQRFLLKDTMICQPTRNCRVEMAIGVDNNQASATYYYARSESLLNECLRNCLSGSSAQESIERLLDYIGTTYHCGRTYIFEMQENNTITNTYEWCAEGVEPQIDQLQEVPSSSVDWWVSLFSEGQPVAIHDLEEIRDDYPETYAVLKPQGITSLVAGPIMIAGKTIGFIGVDNPERQMMPLLQNLLSVIGYLLVSLLKRRDLHNHLTKLSYHDSLTGAFNRNELAKYYEKMPMSTAGVIYCDITGLKMVNDTQGHAAGDHLIQHFHRLIRECVESEMIYRAGGDEFIAICSNYTKERFDGVVRRLRAKVDQDEGHMALGYVWSDEQPLNLHSLISRADQVMYEDKRSYYKQHSHQQGVERRHSMLFDKAPKAESLFNQFLDCTSCDIEELFRGFSEDNTSSYFYFGDMTKNLFYISDNMRDDFGFPSNVVPGLLGSWTKRISTPKFRDMFLADIQDMLERKRTIHDMRYRVRDVHGNDMWIRCYGRLLWDEQSGQPTFFSGRVTCQDRSFVVDSVTNLPRATVGLSTLGKISEIGQKTCIIGFGLNGITEMNSTRGRATGDRLIKKIAETLLEQLSDKMSFYRAEGARFMAVVNPQSMAEGSETLVGYITKIIKNCYDEMDIPLGKVCSIGLMNYPVENMAMEDVLENLMSLIRLARQNPMVPYVDYSDESVRQIKENSDMVMQLGRDVVDNMRNFRIVVQPMVNAADGRMIGGEVLLRWSFRGKNISPEIFIPILERNNTIQLVGRWVFERATRTCMHLRSHIPGFFLTFNVSLHQLTDSGFIPCIKEALERYRLEGSALIAELTESCLDAQPEKLTYFIEECQRMGLNIALDDFGSGYSSMRMMMQYPFTVIKLDRSLISEIVQSKEKMSFIRSIVYACHEFGKTVCVEGVEHAAQNQIVRDMGCDMIQGFFHYRPMELKDIFKLISGQNKEKAETNAADG